jgi:multidrug efflux system membrane fusion protein
MNDPTGRREEESGPLRAEPLRVPAPRRRSLWRGIAWVVGLLLVVGAVVWWVEGRPAQPARQGRFAANGAMPVVVAAAEKGSINIALNALGTITPLATVTVKTQISGRLTRIAFTEGQHVNQGDLLAEIDMRPYDLALEQAQGQLARDQALLRNAEVDVARYRKLFSEDSIARQTLDTQEALVRQYQGVVKSDQSQVDNAKLNLVYCRIIAPISGRVGLRLVDNGNYVTAGDATGIVVINQLQPITAVFTLPEDNVPAVARRLRSGAILPVTAFDRSQTTVLATGQLMTMDNQIDTTTGTVKLKAQFANDDESLFPNQFVNIQLLVDVLNDATLIPTAAVQRGAPGTFVYVIGADDTVAVRPVKLGTTDGGKVAVLSGLAPGERVVVDGADKLRDGAKISLRDESGAPAAGTGTPAGGATDQPPRQRRQRNSQ